MANAVSLPPAKKKQKRLLPIQHNFISVGVFKAEMYWCWEKLSVCVCTCDYMCVCLVSVI